MKKKSALLLIDIQNDFCPGGSLAVPAGDQVVAIANQLQPFFQFVVASKDWHPSNHISFASNHEGHKVFDCLSIQGIQQVLWPDHCVQETIGSAFHPLLHVDAISQVIYKGIDPAVDSYSAFFDNQHLRATGLHEYLKAQGIDTVYLMGLATDYCVKFSCLDALQLGYTVKVIREGCRGVELMPGDSERAFQEMQKAGAKVVSVHEIVSAC